MLHKGHAPHKNIKVYHLQLQGLDNQATGYLYCRNNQTVSRASSMNKSKVKKAIALRQQNITDVVPILEAHHWRVTPVSGDKVQ
ncbi:MAG: hypothetical protein WBA93_19870 [Microcoleaceae cyanobacterium]